MNILWLHLLLPKPTCWGLESFTASQRLYMRLRVQPYQDKEGIGPLVHRLHCHLKVLSLNIHLHCPKGTRSHLLKAMSCPRFTITTIHVRFKCLVHKPWVLFQVGSNYHIHYVTLNHQLLIMIYFPSIVFHNA